MGSGAIGFIGTGVVARRADFGLFQCVTLFGTAYFIGVAEENSTPESEWDVKKCLGRVCVVG